MKSNASVGPPIEVLLYQNDSFSFEQHYNFEAEDPYLLELRNQWENKLNEAFIDMPRIPKLRDSL
jgi:putative proteasome-type protease